MSRAWSLALPLLTVIVVSYALLVAGAPRAVVGARVYGGPTEGATALSLRAEVVQRDGEREAPYWNGPLAVQARAAGKTLATLSVSHALHGVTDFTLPLATPLRGPVQLELRDALGALLAGGEASLSVERWAAHARRRGGWIRGRDAGGLVISVAAERGAFVVGASDPLLIRVEQAGSAVAGAALTISAEGALLSDAQGLKSDARGRARVGFRATELNPTVRVEARTDDGQSGVIDTGVALVPGAFYGALTPEGLRVESAAPRDEAYFSVVNDAGRVSGGVLALTPDGRGGSVGVSSLAAFSHPAWLVLSSDVDQNSAATIGWPLDVGAEPAQTFDVPEQLLLDGLPSAFAREQQRRSRVRWLSGAFIALAFALSVVLLVLRVRAADRDISTHLREGLDPEIAARVAPRRLLALLVAVLGIALGFVALGLIVVARSR